MVGDCKMVPCSHLLSSRVLIAVLLFFANILTVAGIDDALQILLNANAALRRNPGNAGMHFVDLVRYYPGQIPVGKTSTCFFQFDDYRHRRSGVAKVILYDPGSGLSSLSPITIIRSKGGPNWTPISETTRADVLWYANVAAQLSSEYRLIYFVEVRQFSVSYEAAGTRIRIEAAYADFRSRQSALARVELLHNEDDNSSQILKFEKTAITRSPEPLKPRRLP